MTLLELHYTSAEQGLGGSPGFQFVELSAGLDPGICRQVESLLAYEPPRTAPSQPTYTEIAGFPVALSHTLLAGGTAVVCNTTYTGTDYSGRFGNFYAHALYLPGGPGDLGDILPIDTWASPSWRTARPPRGLAAVQHIVPGKAITRDALLDFAGQRRSQLEAVLTDVMNSFGHRGLQVVLGEEKASAVALWIAMACRSLPRLLAQRLTFTTYTRRPYQSSQQVIGIMPSADFSFTNTELATQYRVHAEPGRSSPPVEPICWAATAAAIWRAGKPELFDAAYADITVPGDSPGQAWLDTLAGQPAATALAAGTDLPQAAIAAALSWATANAGAQRTDQFWQGLAAEIARSSSQIPVSDLGRLCRQIDARQPPEVTDSLTTSYLSRLPAEITRDTEPDRTTIQWVSRRLHDNPHLAEIANLRGHLQTAFSEELSVRHALLLLQIADAAGIDNPGRAGEAVLGPALLAGSSLATEVAEFLSTTANMRLRTRILDFLEDAARQSDGRAAAELARGTDGHWLLSADLSDFPLLSTAVRLAAECDPSRVAAFRRATALLSASDQHDLRCAYGLAWPDQSPTPTEASELLAGEFALPIWEIPSAVEAFIDLIRRTPVISTETIRLAEMLRIRISPPDPQDRALLDLVIATGRLREVARQPADSGLAEELPRKTLALLATWPYPGAPRDAAADALLRLLVAPGRLEKAGIPEQAELHDLATCGDKDLITAFTKRTRESLGGELTRSPRLHASCFVLWRCEYGKQGDPAWPAAREILMTDLLTPSARKMDDGTRQLTARLIEERAPGLGNEWLQLTQSRGPMTRLPRLRLLYRRTR